eukprot:TRINITY_DN26145_c0_g1_i2.p2 TRINITY_DN26145_c0_g1~~TRINITY_DN26145_c0_g1_i2.p2  ORF type:complete len:142 (-),score=36.91 TRINITY_DN26145_c0_g1_i2:356-781(-)
MASAALGVAARQRSRLLSGPHSRCAAAAGLEHAKLLAKQFSSTSSSDSRSSRSGNLSVETAEADDCCRLLLGLPEKYEEAELRSAYRRMARTLHPDRGGKTEKFQELQQCYDKEMRALRTARETPEWLLQMKKDFANFSCC